MQKYCLLLLLLLYILQCNIQPKSEIFNPEYTPKISVLGVISNNDDQEFVVVERTLHLNEDDQTCNSIIEDAVVQIVDENDTVQFSFYKKAPDENLNDSYIYEFRHNDLTFSINMNDFSLDRPSLARFIQNSTNRTKR